MNRPVHTVAGVSAAIVQLLADEDNSDLPLAEVIGRLLGGAWGSRGPDLIDPPTSPGHRGVGHAIVPVLLTFLLIAHFMPTWQQTVRSQAATARAQAGASPPGEGWGYQCTATACEFLLGLIIGVPVGYGSHVLFDATTPAGLPLLMQGHQPAVSLT